MVDEFCGRTSLIWAYINMTNFGLKNATQLFFPCRDKKSMNSSLFRKLSSKNFELPLQSRIFLNRKLQMKYPGSNYLESNFKGHYSNGII